MSRVEVLDTRPFVSPDLARSLLTVRAAISLARFAVQSVAPAGERERMRAGNDRAESFRLVGLFTLDTHDAPEDLASGQVQPADRSAANTEIRLDTAFLPRADHDVAGDQSGVFEPVERCVVGRPEAPGTGLDRIRVGGKPTVDEACEVLGVTVFGESALQVERRPNDSGSGIAGLHVEARREVDLIE